MPAEWEPHEATWISWPHKEASWPGKFEPVGPVMAEIVSLLAEGESVFINVVDGAMEEQVRALLAARRVDPKRVRFFRIPTNDAWVRDHGPMFVVRDAAGKRERERAIIDWGYNAWGNKYPPFDLDDVVPQKIAGEFGLEWFEPGIVMEGGSIDLNGKGTLLTSEACLLNPNRNPHLAKPEIERYLRDFLGVRHILWVGDGIVGDDTDGHIDDLSRFVDASTIVTAIEEDPQDENHAILQENLKRLEAMKDQDGRRFRIVTMPMPGPVLYEDQRLPASYANFYVANARVLVPTYRHANDARAIEILQKCFPDRKVVGVDCTDLIWGLGAIHCLTQQMPAI
ncbi:MAG: agmatine deiminase family protein [Verrucomicrobiae bacterium]|nr:agmatine deiminase family protein [Verrucomicrobiae bacterium]